MCVGLSEREMNGSLETLKIMADRLDASMTILRERHVSPPPDADHQPLKRVAEVLIR